MSKHAVTDDQEKKKEEEEATPFVYKTNPKENENLILMTKNYQKFFENQCECSSLSLPSKLLQNSKTNWMSSDKLNELRRKAHEAVRLHKVFILKGYFHTVRKALTDRGYVERMENHSRCVRSNSSGFLLEDLVQALPSRRPGESKRAHIVKCERSIMSRFLEHSAVDLLWTVRRDKSDYTHVTKNQNMLINRFSKSPFTSKEGLCMALKDFHWYYEEGTAEAYFPRCFNVFNPEELNEFIENFRMTSCISFLRWFVEIFDDKGPFSLLSDEGRVPMSSITFAMNRCKDFIDYCCHNDIDIEEEVKIWEHDWDVFLTHHYLLTHENAKFLMIEECSASVTLVENYVDLCRELLERIKPLWPQFGLDGTLNIWIVKPGNKCRGRGIMLMNNIKQIISIVNPPVTKSRYVVQKYIERPLIIHKTKFDIRQWFLINSVQPLIIWFYKESYLRFSSQQFNLSNYHESVHLTNHAIQKKYLNGVRDDRLPQENMWDAHSFQAYLRQIGKNHLWMERIYPGMQRAIIGTMLACQENMDRRPNTFELYGADFMISDDFYPWLIEINASPDLAPSTSVTARLCPEVVEDTIKVVVDRRLDSAAETGYFEMIYKQVIPKVPAYMGLNLSLRGQRIIPKFQNSKREKSPCARSSLQSIYSLARLASSSSRPRNKGGPGPTIMDLMQCLNFKTRLDREKELIQRKIRSSTLYRKPSFSYNITVHSKGRHNKLKEQAMDKEEDNSVQDEKQSASVVENIQCIGNKYVDLSSSKIHTSSSADSKILGGTDWEKVTSSYLQSTVSQSSSASYRTPTQRTVQENLKKSKTVKATKKMSDTTEDTTDSSADSKRKIHAKLMKPPKISHFYAVGLSLRTSYSDAIISKIETENLVAKKLISPSKSTNVHKNTKGKNSARKLLKTGNRKPKSAASEHSAKSKALVAKP